VAQARKKRARRKSTPRQASTGSPWLVLCIGLVCGAVLSGLYFGYKENEPGRFGSGIRSLMEDEPEPPRRAEAPEPEPVQPREPPPRVKLDYHEVLPNIDTIISESELIEDEAPVERRPGHEYILQAGSYRQESDAETLKARLALAGFEAVIQRVNIDGKGTYFRVRLGPYQSTRKLQLDKKRLAGRGIDALALRLDAPAEQARQTQ